MANAGALQRQAARLQHPRLRGEVTVVVILHARRTLDLRRMPALLAALEHVNPNEHAVMLERRLKNRPGMILGDEPSSFRNGCVKVWLGFDHDAGRVERTGDVANRIA